MRSATEAHLDKAKPYPLGAVWYGTSVHFSLYSERATGVELCLFDDAGAEQRIALKPAGHYLWQTNMAGIGPGQRYGYRVAGPYDPASGNRFNPHKLLVDPYAKAIAGTFQRDAPIYGYKPGESDGTYDDADDAAGVAKGLIIDPRFDWQGDERPLIPWQQSVIYEVHVKGFTARHPDIPPEIRGTYAALAYPASLAYLKALGITAVELLPVHATFDDPARAARGLSNYWGYSTLNYFAPDARFSSRGDGGGQVTEFKEMVRLLHAAGLEVILDVVYNHTCEGNEFGPTLSLRGIDNHTYYRLEPGNEREYLDFTGTGNTLNTPHPQVLKLIMDSLRYWVQEMHVDGFRFDLALTLGRELNEFDQSAAFFDIIHQDPLLSQVKLIAEPWDVGPGGYQLGHFPLLWSEWNGKFRDTVRGFWHGDDSDVDDLAYRLSGSSDLYSGQGRGPLASINFITSHDGFTLNDLVSYNRKHNEANGENNGDGINGDLSANYGAEGPTDDPEIIAVRGRQIRNFLATLLFSQGVPMLCGGDEIGRTQRGNNNAYCQDNEISWFDWQLDDRRRKLLDFTRQVIALRQRFPALRRQAFFRGAIDERTGLKDITWLRSDAREMTYNDWFTSWVRSLGILIADETGTDEHLLLLFNAYTDSVIYTLPAPSDAGNWEILLCTDRDTQTAAPSEPTLELCPRSLMLLRWLTH